MKKIQIVLDISPLNSNLSRRANCNSKGSDGRQSFVIPDELISVPPTVAVISARNSALPELSNKT